MVAAQGEGLRAWPAKGVGERARPAREARGWTGYWGGESAGPDPCERVGAETNARPVSVSSQAALLECEDREDL